MKIAASLALLAMTKCRFQAKNADLLFPWVVLGFTAVIHGHPGIIRCPPGDHPLPSVDSSLPSGSHPLKPVSDPLPSADQSLTSSSDPLISDDHPLPDKIKTTADKKKTYTRISAFSGMTEAEEIIVLSY